MAATVIPTTAGSYNCDSDDGGAAKGSCNCDSDDWDSDQRGAATWLWIPVKVC